VLWREVLVELRVLRYFLAVVDEGSVTAASATVHVAQSSLSRQLRGLERELGLDLFVRGARGLRLSGVGKSFVPMARDIVSRADTARAVMGSLATGESMGLRVAAPPTTVADILAPFVAATGEHGVVVDLREATPDGVYEILGRGEADVGISTLPPSGRLATMIVWEAPLYALLPTHHPLGERVSLDLEELLEYPLVLMDRRSVTRRVFDDAVARAGLRYEPAFETGSTHFAQALSAAGRGVAILSDDPVFGLSAATIRAEDTELGLPLFAAWDPDHYAAQRIGEILGELRRFVVSHYAAGIPWSDPSGAAETAPSTAMPQRHGDEHI
jgi:LysR family transcriptional regulator, benzoate and cis,cis-muconate-responsive activator of ben and cat genes